jgi:hypothetical protein
MMNPDARYVQIFAYLATKDKTKTPVVNSITLGYHEGETAKTVTIQGDSSLAQNGAAITVGFKKNNWGETGQILNVRSDTNDMVNTSVSGTSLVLSHGEYERTYTSEGDWSDGSMVRAKVTTSGTLKLDR